MSVFLKLKQQVESAFEKAEKGESKLVDRILRMEGMTGKKTRHFYNNLLNMEDARYLEIGTWKGSSVCSAMYKNNATVVCIDNWSEFGGPKNDFMINFTMNKGNNHARFIQNDCFKVDITQLPRFNIYMYDGNHASESHYKALVHYYSCLDNVFIFIVDDWNWEHVRTGTYKAINQLKLNILYEKELRLTNDNSHTPEPLAKETWHNGMYVAILQK